MTTITHQIKHRYTGDVIFQCELTEQESGLATRHALEKAVSERAKLHGANLGGANLGSANLGGANLGGANLCGANLGGANLRGANLHGANLYGANLHGANLCGANLGRANLHGANLYGANLHGANLCGANLGSANLDGANLGRAKLHGANLGDGTRLVGDRPLLQIGPIGSREDHLLALITTDGVVLKTGCFTGYVDEFIKKLNAEHGDSNHGKEYRAALAMIAAHAEIWTPEGDQA